MVFTVAAYKGGVGKTTTAVHLAAALGRQAPTLLVDTDRVPGAYRWHQNGKLETFQAAQGHETTNELLQRFDEQGYVVIDTPAAPTRDEIIAFGEQSDLLIVPATPDALSLEALIDTLFALRNETVRYAVLLTIAPPAPSKELENARTALEEVDVPLFDVSIPRAAAFQHAARESVLVDQVKKPGVGRLAHAYDRVVEEALARTGGKHG